MIRKEPSLRETFEALPSREEYHQAIAEMMDAVDLVAGSDGGDDWNGRVVYSITLASEDLLEIHTSSREVRGGAKDSGRAKSKWNWPRWRPPRRTWEVWTMC